MKTTIKRLGLSIATISILSTSSYALPVIDAGNIIQTTATAIATAGELKIKVQEWLDLTTAYMDGSFIDKLKGLTELLEDNNLDIFDLDIDNPKSQIGKYAKELFEHYTLFDDCKYDYLNDHQKQICKNKLIRSVQEVATFSILKDSLGEDLNKIKSLASQLGDSEGMKKTTDINAGVQVLMAQMQAKKLQLEMMLANNKAKAEVDARQKEQMWKKTRNNIQKIEIH